MVVEGREECMEEDVELVQSRWSRGGAWGEDVGGDGVSIDHLIKKIGK